MGEAIFVNARKFGDAVEVLKYKQDPMEKMFLAKAYDGLGNIEMAAKTCCRDLHTDLYFQKFITGSVCSPEEWV